MNKSERWMLKLSFGLRARTSMYKRIAQFLKARKTLNETLQRISARYKNQLGLVERIRVKLNKSYKPRGDFRARILQDILSEMATGRHFSDALKPWVPAGEHMLIAAGERGKGLDSGMLNAAVMSAAASRIKKTIIGNSVYPMVLMGVFGGMMIMFKRKLVPEYIKIVPVSSWPASAKKLYEISTFVNSYTLLMTLVICAVFFGAAMTLPRWRGKPRAIADHFPPWSVYRVQQASSFMISLSSLLAAGVTAYGSLQMMHRNASPYFKWHLERMMAVLSTGPDNAGKAMDTGLLDRESAGDVEDYSQLGNFRHAIEEIGARILEESVDRITAVMSTARTLMLVLVAASVLWIYMTTYALWGSMATTITQGPSTETSANP